MQSQQGYSKIVMFTDELIDAVDNPEEISKMEIPKLLEQLIKYSKVFAAQCVCYQGGSLNDCMAVIDILKKEITKRFERAEQELRAVELTISMREKCPHIF